MDIVGCVGDWDNGNGMVGSGAQILKTDLYSRQFRPDFSIYLYIIKCFELMIAEIHLIHLQSGQLFRKLGRHFKKF